jgi:hypothetical protein
MKQQANFFELIQRLQQIIKVHKAEKPTIQSKLDTKKCIKVFKTQLATSKCNQDTSMVG